MGWPENTARGPGEQDQDGRAIFASLVPFYRYGN